MQFDERALTVLRALNSAGHEAYFVGGCVRDRLRGEVPHDYDVTTSALPQEILAVFSHLPVVETGIQHGTVTVFSEGLPVEVTTFRVDGSYADSRHPDHVTFTASLRDDLARRDFTVNAIAWSESSGVVDPFCGRQDLNRGILRCVGNGNHRFSEDGLRILRGLRFASVLGFEWEEETKNALLQQKNALKFVAPERIQREFLELLCGKHVFPVLCAFPEVLGVFLWELLPCVDFDQHNFHHVFPVYTHLAKAVASVPPLPHLRLAALLHDIGKPQTFSLDEAGVGHFYGHAHRSAEMAEEILKRLRMDNDTAKRVITLIRHHDTPIAPDAPTVRRRLNKLGEEGFFDLLALIRGDNLALSPQFCSRQKTYDEIEALAREILAEHQCFSLKDLAVKGDDLLALGYQGKAVGMALKTLLNGVMDGVVENRKEDLLEYLKKEQKNRNFLLFPLDKF